MHDTIKNLKISNCFILCFMSQTMTRVSCHELLLTSLHYCFRRLYLSYLYYFTRH